MTVTINYDTLVSNSATTDKWHKRAFLLNYHSASVLLLQFSPYKPVMQSETEGFVKRPELADKIHCVVFVLSATQIQLCPPNLSSTMQQLREHISDLGKKGGKITAVTFGLTD